MVEQLENSTSAWMPHPILDCNFPKILFDIFCLCMVVLWGSFHISKAKVFGNIFGGYTFGLIEPFPSILEHIHSKSMYVIGVTRQHYSQNITQTIHIKLEAGLKQTDGCR